MKVKELIKQLEQLDSNFNVIIEDTGNEEHELAAVFTEGSNVFLQTGIRLDQI